MLKNIIFVVLLSISLFACSDSEETHFNYSDINNTIGLNVEPSNSLRFQTKNLGDVLEFKLYFSTEFLTPIGIDNKTENYGSSFENNPPFNAVECLSKVADYGYCPVSIKMLNTATEGDSGSIQIMFYYNKDYNEETIGEVKYHKLNFEYRNDTNN